MAGELPDFDERRSVRQKALVRQSPRVGRNTRLVALLMAAAAGEKYHADPDVPKVDYSTMPAVFSPSTLLNLEEVRDMYVMLERVFGFHPDGYAFDLPGLPRLFRDFFSVISSSLAAPAQPLAGTIR